MMQNIIEPYTFADRLRSFRYSVVGILHFMRTHNGWLLSTTTALVIAAGFFLHVSAVEWCLLIMATASIWVSETLNTALEVLADAVTEEHHPLIGKAKDVASGAVMMSVIGAAGVGIIVFGSHLQTFWM